MLILCFENLVFLINADIAKLPQRLQAGIHLLRSADIFFAREAVVLSERREKIEVAYSESPERNEPDNA